MCMDSSDFNTRSSFFSYGEVSVSNSDAVVPASDAAGASASTCKRTSAGRSSHTSSQVAVSFAPCFINVFGPQELRLVTFPGTANTSRFCSSAQRAVILVPLYSPASTTSTPALRPLMIRLRMGKFCGAANVSTGNSDTSAPPKARICSAIRLFSRG